MTGTQRPVGQDRSKQCFGKQMTEMQMPGLLKLVYPIYNDHNFQRPQHKIPILYATRTAHRSQGVSLSVSLPLLNKF